MTIAPTNIKKLGTYEVKEGNEVKTFKVYKANGVYFTKPTKTEKLAEKK